MDAAQSGLAYFEWRMMIFSLNYVRHIKQLFCYCVIFTNVFYSKNVVLILKCNEYYIALSSCFVLTLRLSYMFVCVGRWRDEYFLDEMTKNYSFRKKVSALMQWRMVCNLKKLNWSYNITLKSLWLSTNIFQHYVYHSQEIMLVQRIKKSFLSVFSLLMTSIKWL